MSDRLQVSPFDARHPNCQVIPEPFLSVRVGLMFHSLLLLAAMLLTCGCARYHMGTRTLFPPDISTVYVPMFESDTFRRHLGEWLTEAVIKEIELQTPYKVVGSPDADSVLSGRLERVQKKILVDNGLDEGRQLEVAFYVVVRWVNRRGESIRGDQQILLTPEQVEILHAGTFVPEGGQSLVTAEQQAIRQIARQVVGLMEAPW